MRQFSSITVRPSSVSFPERALPPGNRSTRRNGNRPTVSGVELKIMDDDGAERPEGADGNICVRSGMVSNGYLWGDDGQALRCFDGWYTVGTRAMWTPVSSTSSAVGPT
ncbi:amp-Dependent synthetase and ligase [Arthrobacter sp. Hiyo8]|nr:amp-Dependent synthetase and ligase [Arthrobacter sp. Hiyo8]